ncbi:MAG: glycosyltransferase [Candidatus Latescibacterota bacterium]|nr:glycosyltransferase [Candidatus Latescibacterota bacterium]
MRIMFFGSYVINEAYPVNRVLLKGIRSAGIEVVECRVDLWEGFLHEMLGKGLVKKVIFLCQAFYLYPQLLWRYLRSTSPDVIVVGYPGYIDIILARLLNMFSKRLLVLVSFISLYDTVIVDRGSFKSNSLRSRLLFTLDRLAFGSADWVLVDTEQLAIYYADLFNLPPKRFQKSLVGNVFDGITSKRTQHSKNMFRVLFFGTYVPLHGAHYIVDAAIELRNRPVEFVLIGNGQEFDEVRTKTEVSNLDNITFFNTWYSIKQLTQAMADADVCLGVFGTTPKASRVIPYKIFGALSLGRPIITRDSPAIRELLVDGESVLLCPPGDGSALAKCIERFRNDRELCFRIGEEGKKCYEREASNEAIGRTFVRNLAGVDL